MDLGRTDLQFILQQIELTEQHIAAIKSFEAANGAGSATPAIKAALLLPLLGGDPLNPAGLRTVDGSLNNLVQATDGAADQPFARLLEPPAVSVYPAPAPGQRVVDPQPRQISNLIADQTAANPAAQASSIQAGGAPALWQGVTFTAGDGVSVRYSSAAQAFQDQVLVQAPSKPAGVLVDPSGQLLDLSGQLLDEQGQVILTIPSSVAAGEPFNAWTTLFGQGFDHGLDFLPKGGQGTVVIPLQPDDPLYVPGSPTNFMLLERAQQGLTNQVTPWVDMNQAYASHPALQVFLREYTRVEDPASSTGFRTVPTGRLLSGPQGSLPTWADIQRNAAEFLGLELTDAWVGNSPYVVVDDYGNFIPAADGLAQVWLSQPNGTVAPASLRVLAPGATQPLLQLGTPGGATGSAAVTNHAFLLDIAHTAQPGLVDPDRNPATSNTISRSPDTDTATGNVLPPLNASGVQTVYDDELLRAHYVAGDGRVNENSGLTAFHSIFHSEHDRLVADYQRILIADAQQSGDISFLNRWLLPQSQLADASALQGVNPLSPASANLLWNGERLFQAGRFLVEMQYQHGVFEEFARTLQPNLPFFNGATQAVDPAITAEFAHAVYRFGHSMLTESVDRLTPNWQNTSTGLIEAFLNPTAFTRSGDISSSQATGEVLRGATRQVANEIDEFTTGSLRNNLVGLPLDLAAVNIARGRDVNLPKLNDARRQLSQLPDALGIVPYSSWGLPAVAGSIPPDPGSFAAQLRQPLSLINFVAAYGTHPVLRAATTTQARREGAMLLLTGLNNAESTTLSDGSVVTQAALQDRLEFWSGTGAYAADLGGLESVDLWIGGLAEKPNPNDGSHLGSTFSYVFEQTLLNLQSTDRLYYLDRLALQGNLLAQVEANSFASMVVRNSDANHLPGLLFNLPTWYLEANPALQFNASLSPDSSLDPAGVSREPATVGPDGDPTLNPSTTLRYSGIDAAVLGGTDESDLLQAADGANTFWGDGGNDYIFSGRGNDQIYAGDGDDIVVDAGNDGAIGDVIRGEAGHDVVKLSTGPGAVHAGAGSDWVMAGMGLAEIFGDTGNDFLQSGSGLGPVLGGTGDDWLEGAPQGSDLSGESGAPPLIDPVSLLPLQSGQEIGHDVLVSIDGASTSRGDLGDDIHLNGLAADRFAGGGGFDWSASPRQAQLGQGLTVWLQAGAPNLLVPVAITDRFDQHVEALSGSSLNDRLIGDDRVDLSPVGDQQAGTDDRLIVDPLNPLIAGLHLFLPQGAVSVDAQRHLVFSQGNILLGGAGADDLVGLGGNDVLDGDLSLRIQLALPLTSQRFSSMNELNQAVLNRFVSPADVRIVRELVREDSNGADRAIFRGRPEQYRIEGLRLIGDQPVLALDTSLPSDGDGWLRIVHDTPLTVGDGSDFLRNVEFLVFQNDQTDVNVDGLIDTADWTIVDIRPDSALSPALAGYLSAFQSTDVAQPSLDVLQPQSITLTASQEIISDLSSSPTTLPALEQAGGAVTSVLAGLPVVQRAELPQPTTPPATPLPPTPTTPITPTTPVPPSTTTPSPPSIPTTPSTPATPLTPTTPVTPPSPPIPSDPVQDRHPGLQPRLLTSANTLLGELRQFTSSLQQLSPATTDRPPIRTDSSTPAPSSVSGSAGYGAPSSSPAEEIERSPVPRQLNGFSESLAQMRSALSEMQNIAFSAPATSVAPPPVAPVPVAALPTPPAPQPDPTQTDVSAAVPEQPPSSAPVDTSTEQPPDASAPPSAMAAETVMPLSSALLVEPLPVCPTVLQPLTPVTPGLAEPVQSERRGRLIESSGDLSLYKTGRRRYEVEIGSDVEPIELALGRRALKGYHILGAEAHADGVQLMMRDRDRWASGLFNLDGDLISIEGLNRAQARRLESKFDQDFDRNGSIDRLGSKPVALRFGLSVADVQVGSHALMRSEEAPVGSADLSQLVTPSMRSSISW